MIRRLLSAWIALIALIWLGTGHAQFNGCTAGFCNTKAPAAAGNTVTQDVCTGAAYLGGTADTSFTNKVDITVGSGLTDPVVMLFINFVNNNNATSAVTATYSGTSMTFHTSVNAASGNGAAHIFGLRNPASGAHNFSASWTGANQPSAYACSYKNVAVTNDGTAFTNANSATGNSATSSVTITNSANDMVVASHDGFSCTSISGTNQTNLYIANTGNQYCAAANQAQGTGSGIAMTATDTSGQWAAVGISLAHD